MSASNTVYLNLREMTQVHRKDVYVKDVGTVYCSNLAIQSKCRAMKIKSIREDGQHCYIESALDVIAGLEQLDPSIQVNNVGKVEYIIDYHPPKKPIPGWQWAKTVFVCIIGFCGAAFAIMTFNNDVNVTDVFQKVYRLITGEKPQGFTILELSYSVGLAGGILLFFNHFAGWKLNTDPTPLEVEMRLYEENIGKTLIQNDSRKEQEVDVS